VIPDPNVLSRLNPKVPLAKKERRVMKVGQLTRHTSMKTISSYRSTMGKRSALVGSLDQGAVKVSRVTEVLSVNKEKWDHVARKESEAMWDLVEREERRETKEKEVPKVPSAQKAKRAIREIKAIEASKVLKANKVPKVNVESEVNEASVDSKANKVPKVQQEEMGLKSILIQFARILKII
jgi:hypothetical protein